MQVQNLLSSNLCYLRRLVNEPELLWDFQCCSFYLFMDVSLWLSLFFAGRAWSHSHSWAYNNSTWKLRCTTTVWSAGDRAAPSEQLGLKALLKGTSVGAVREGLLIQKCILLVQETLNPYNCYVYKNKVWNHAKAMWECERVSLSWQT